MSKGKLSGKEVAEIKASIVSGGEFRVHLIHSSSGLTCKARIWHPDGYVVGSASGGGYDKEGTALGQAITLFFGEELRNVPLPERDANGRTTRGFYGLSESKSDGRRWIDGACGLQSVIRILEALGFESVRDLSTGKLSTLILATGYKSAK